MESNESNNPKPTTSTKRGRKPRAKGLGDTIEQITTATGIKAAVDWFSEKTGIDCGCEARKEKLNKLLQYSRVECLTHEEYEWLTEFYNSSPNQISSKQQEYIAALHARIFNHRHWQPCTCSPKDWIRFIEELRKVYEEYNASAQS